MVLHLTSVTWLKTMVLGLWLADGFLGIKFHGIRVNSMKFNLIFTNFILLWKTLILRSELILPLALSFFKWYDSYTIDIYGLMLQILYWYYLRHYTQVVCRVKHKVKSQFLLIEINLTLCDMKQLLHYLQIDMIRAMEFLILIWLV